MALPERIGAVFLDVGGPVYSDDNFVRAVLAALDELRAERGQVPADRATFGRIYDEIRNRQSGSLRTALATEFLDDQSRDTLHERTRRHWVHPAGTCYADVRPLLERLHGRARIGVLANQEPTVVDSLRRDGLAQYIDVWGVSAIVGHEKPSPALFEWALREARTEPGQAVHIGNRLDTDVRPARALGLGTVWVIRGEAPDVPSPEQLDEPDLAVPDLSGLADVLLPRTAAGHG